jgi:hypothetical protein
VQGKWAGGIKGKRAKCPSEALVCWPAMQPVVISGASSLPVVTTDQLDSLPPKRGKGVSNL